MKNGIFILLIVSFLISISVQLKETINNIKVEIYSFAENKVGKKGVISFKASCSDKNIFEEKDIEEKKKFESTISDVNKQNYKVSCRFWKSDGYELVIFCNLNENIPKGKYTINLNSTTVIYNNYNITILHNYYYSFTKVDKNVIQLYSDNQNITVEEGKDSYELKFKVNAYNNEKIYFYKGHYCTRYLNNCKLENGELKCIMSLSVLDEITEESEDDFSIAYMTDENRLLRFEFVQYIDIYYLNSTKEQIYVSITKILENVADYDSFIAYETNITDISKFTSELEKFELSFDDNQKFECGFKKYDNYPLLLLCQIREEGTFTLSEIKEEKILTDINIKYDFRIQPVNNNEKIISKDKRYFYIRFIFTEVLDFTSSDSLTIEYLFDKHPDEIKGITLNKDSSDLECKDIGKIKQCIVPKSHFEGKKTGYYFTMHTNHLNEKSFSCEVPPIKVILPDSNNTLIIILSIIGGLIIIILIIFVICFCRKRLKSQEIEVNEDPKDIGL